MVGTTRGVLCSLRLSSRAATSRDWTRMFNILRNDLSLRAGFRLSVARLSRTHQTRGKRWDVISDTLPQYTKEAKTRPLFSTLQTQFNGGERTLLTSINGRCRTSVGFNLNEGDRRPCGRGLTSCSAGGSGRHRARRKDSVCESAAGRSIDWARDVAQQQMQAVQTAPIEEAATRSPSPCRWRCHEPATARDDVRRQVRAKLTRAPGAVVARSEGRRRPKAPS